MKTYSKAYTLLYLSVFIISCKHGATPDPVKKPVNPVDKQMLTGWWAPTEKNSNKSIIYFGADNFFYSDTTGKSIPFAGNWNVGSTDTVYYNNDHNATNYTALVSKLTTDSLVFRVVGTNSTQRFLKVNRPVITSSAITTIAGIGTFGNTGNGGPATAAKLSAPCGLAFDKAGNLFFCDRGSRTIRKISATDGKITTIAGNGGNPIGDFVNNVPAISATLFDPVFLVLDADDNIYFSDSMANRICKISATDGKLTLVAGSGIQYFGGDGGQATLAYLHEPQGLALDKSNNLYFSDLENYRIRKVSLTTGIITTIAGTGEWRHSGDGGPATAADLTALDMVVDAAGNIYFSDFSFGYIRKIAAGTGIITNIAGNGSNKYSRDGDLAVNAGLFLPFGIRLDSKGDIYFTENGGHVVRKITMATGIITTIAGTGYNGYTGDGIHATAYSLNNPYGIAFDAKDNLYIGDRVNNRIRKVVAK